MAARPRPARESEPGLLQPRYDPETPGESEQSQRDCDDRRWQEERPPHYEAR